MPRRIRGRRFRPARRKLLLSFLASLILPLLIGFGGFLLLRATLTAQAQQAWLDRVRRTGASIDGVLREMDSLAIVLARTPWVGKVAYMDGDSLDYTRIEPYDLGTYTASLKNYQMFDERIDRIMIAFPEKDSVVHMNGISTYEEFFRHYYRTDEIGIGQWTDLLGRYADVRILPPMDVSSYGRNDELLTYIAPIRLNFSDQSPRAVPYVVTTPKAVLLVSIQASGLVGMLDSMAADEGAVAYILDDDGVVASRAADGGTRAQAPPVLPGGKEIGGFRIDRTSYLTVQYASPTSGWRYVAVVPMSTAMAPYGPTMAAMLAALFLCLASGFAVSFALYRSNYRPLDSLVERMARAVPDDVRPEADANEYGLIDRVFQSVVESGNALRSRLDFCYPLAVRDFLTNLLYGAAGNLDVAAVEKSLGIEAAPSPWTVAVLYAEGVRRDPAVPPALRWVLDGTAVYLVSIDSRRDAAIVHDGDPERVVSVVEEAAALHVPEDATRVVVGIGNAVDGLERIGASYRQALHAVNGAFGPEATQARVIRYDDARDAGTIACPLPPDVEAELQKRVRSGEFENVRTYLDPLIDESLRKAGVGTAAVQVLFYSLLGVVLRTAAGLGLPASSLIDEQRLMRMDTPQDLRSGLHGMFRAACDAVRQERRGYLQRNREEILRFFDENCLDENLTLHSLADAFDVSAPYLSKFIKEQTGSNFLEFLAQKRVAIAQELLRSGRYSIQEVGERVGYSNALTFRRVFRRVSGINPGDFRDRSASLA